MISLLVLRVKDIEESKKFYELLGISFIKEQHNNGAVHYASTIDGLVFEIYPSTPCYPVECSTRIGFKLNNIEQIIENLKSNNYQDSIVKDLCFNNQHIHALLKDPDGRKIELNELD